ncbi:MAG: hypothetical protein L0J13_12615, partial [Brevibacterium sp.]|nr:hypothetical protein [Brevibacterium sp.]
EPKVGLFDEPTSAPDREMMNEVVRTMEPRQKHQGTQSTTAQMSQAPRRGQAPRTPVNSRSV